MSARIVSDKNYSVVGHNLLHNIIICEFLRYKVKITRMASFQPHLFQSYIPSSRLSLAQGFPL